MIAAVSAGRDDCHNSRTHPAAKVHLFLKKEAGLRLQWRKIDPDYGGAETTAISKLLLL
jgi:hypothetical protein